MPPVSSRSDPGVDATCPVQQTPSVPGTLDRLNEKQESKPSEQPTEDGGRHDHERRHHHETQDDEGGAAVVVKVTADGRGGIEDLQGKNTEGIIRVDRRAPEDMMNVLALAASLGFVVGLV